MKKFTFLIKTLLTLLVVFPSYSATPYFEEYAPPSLADTLKLSRSQHTEEKGWLPRLTGLPDPKQVSFIEKYVDNVMKKDKGSQCISIDWYLKTMMFQHYSVYQHMLNAHHIYFDEKIAHQWAHILAMILKESSGDSTNITDMHGRTIATDESNARLRHWKEILDLRKHGPIQMNRQTNFGLTQTSADRLTDAFNLTKSQKHDIEFLENRKGVETPRKTPLNTEIAIRRLIWFYQSFAQGRTQQSEVRIPEKDINKPQFYKRHEKGLDLALLYCGTRFMFRSDSDEERKRLRNAMASIAYCSLGNPQQGYGKTEVEEKCFAEWVTLCPALNVDIATLTHLSYFETRGAEPVCKETFQSLINKK